MGDPRDVRNIDELREWLCIAFELRHDCGDADVDPDESEDIDVTDDPREDIRISERWDRLLVGMMFEQWLDLFDLCDMKFWQPWPWLPTLVYLLPEILL